MGKQVQECQKFFSACLRTRVDPAKFQVLFTTFHDRYDSLHSKTVIEALIKQTQLNNVHDPRVPQYLCELLRMRVVSVADVLSCLLPLQPEGSINGQAAYHDQNMLEIAGVSKPSFQALIFQMLIVEISEGLLNSREGVRAAVKALIPWMLLFPGSTTMGCLVAAVLGTNMAQQILVKASAKGLKKPFGRALTPLINHLMQTDLQIAPALDFWQKQLGLGDLQPTHSIEQTFEAVNLGSLAFQESVVDTPSITTRAGTYVYMNALLHARPLFEDANVLHYLNTRYKGDVTTLVIDLTVASFDILANAMYRSEPPEVIALLRSYLVNKLPIFLLNYAGMMFEPMTTEFCVQQALTRLDPTAFPPFSQMFENSVSEARQEFLFACALHQLIPEHSIPGLLGEEPLQSLPAGGRYVKQDLVAQCTANPGRIEQLVGELENMEGNAGEIASALLEIMQTLCSNNDTMTLKGLCNALCRRSATLEVLLLFTTPHDLLRPLCNILDNWQMNEDHGENQPIYDEFGSILLFVMLVSHRFDLQRWDLGINAPGSFVLHYKREANTAKSIDELSEKEHKLLGAWIRGLFDENEGINDELMASASPIEFHMVVATLLDQSLKACQAGYLSMSNLTDGLEYFLQPFLLPSLVAGLTWFAHRIWETTSQSPSLDILMPALTTLIKPRSISSDSLALHSAVLSIVAKSLDHALHHCQTQNPQRVDLTPLLSTIKPHSAKLRRDSASLTELEAWSSTPQGSLLATLRSTVQNLTFWSSELSPSPPQYTHRQLTETVHHQGSKTVLNTLLDEAMLHSSTPVVLDTALDLLVVLISAPQIPSSSSRRTLRDALTAQIDDVHELSKRDLARANLVVRIHRRVEALTGPAMQEQQQPQSVVDVALDAAAEVAVGGGGDGGGAAGGDVMMHAGADVESLPAVDIDEMLGQADQIGDFMAVDGFMDLS